MNGKHSQNNENFDGSAGSGKKTALIIIITALAAAAVTAGVFLLVGLFGGSGKTAEQVTTSAAQTSVAETSTAESSAANPESTAAQSTSEEQSSEQTTEQEQTSADSSSSGAEEIVVPTLSGEEQGEKFSATLTPYYAQDQGSGQELTIREVFGSSYSGGGLTFNEDGTFVDGVTASSASSGAYIVEGDTIVATYSNDKNMVASVLEWNGSTPAEIKITFGEIDVYFK